MNLLVSGRPCDSYLPSRVARQLQLPIATAFIIVSFVSTAQRISEVPPPICPQNWVPFGSSLELHTVCISSRFLQVVQQMNEREYSMDSTGYLKFDITFLSGSILTTT